MKECIERKRVEIISVYVESVGESVPAILAVVLNEDSGSIFAHAMRFGGTNMLLESWGTKQDLDVREFGDTQKRLVQAIIDKIKSLTPDEYLTFIDENDPGKIGIGAIISERGEETS